MNIDEKSAKYWFIFSGKEYESLKKQTLEFTKKNDKKSIEAKNFIQKSILFVNKDNIDGKKMNEASANWGNHAAQSTMSAIAKDSSDPSSPTNLEKQAQTVQKEIDGYLKDRNGKIMYSDVSKDKDGKVWYKLNHGDKRIIDGIEITPYHPTNAIKDFSTVDDYEDGHHEFVDKKGKHYYWYNGDLYDNMVDVKGKDGTTQTYYGIGIISGNPKDGVNYDVLEKWGVQGRKVGSKEDPSNRPEAKPYQQPNMSWMGYEEGIKLYGKSTLDTKAFGEVDLNDISYRQAKSWEIIKNRKDIPEEVKNKISKSFVDGRHNIRELGYFSKDVQKTLKLPEEYKITSTVSQTLELQDIANCQDVNKIKQMVDSWEDEANIQSKQINDIKSRLSRNNMSDTWYGHAIDKTLTYGLGMVQDEYGNDIGPDIGLLDLAIAWNGAGAVASTAIKAAVIKPIAKEGVKQAIKYSIKKGAIAGGKKAASEIAIYLATDYAVDQTGKGIKKTITSIQDLMDKTESDPTVDQTAEMVADANNSASTITSSLKTPLIAVGALASLTFGFIAMKNLWKKHANKKIKNVSDDTIAQCDFKSDGSDYSCKVLAKGKGEIILSKNGKEQDEHLLEEFKSTQFARRFFSECQKKLTKTVNDNGLSKIVANISDNRSYSNRLEFMNKNYKPLYNSLNI